MTRTALLEILDTALHVARDSVRVLTRGVGQHVHVLHPGDREVLLELARQHRDAMLECTRLAERIAAPR